MSISEIYDIYVQYPSVVTDTRKLKEGDFFFALKGPNFNANTFAFKALEAGAAYCVVDEPLNTIAGYYEGNNETQKEAALAKMIVVEDVLTTLQALAGHHRSTFDIPFIAITGSNGKTTTKELVYAVLSSHFKTYTTQGNLNNHIGVPLTILSIKKDAQMAVIEMGANHQKEIEGYCVYTKPTHGIISNCGKAHLEGFGGEEGVKKGKGELYSFLRGHNGTAFVYTGYDYLNEMSAGIQNIVPYISGEIQSSEPFLTVSANINDTATTVSSQLVGSYNLPNILCALTIGKHFGVPENKMVAAIKSYAPSNSRSQLINKGTNTIILDAYNANPSSMKVAIENFAKLAGQNKIVMLGAMMELGDHSSAEHLALLELIASFSFTHVVLVGGDFLAHQNAMPQFIYFKNTQEAKAWLAEQNPSNAQLLIKGSRSMQMESVLA
ncbi:MAG: UDP-N-acetylmuramoyl-tripeptide--D-alanyl-D-alanine ligase [Sediminibacterium sp.]|nr:UDP-N-acetylmuramoyl-tripeptide--D-alanyl-D-alanine ligase [Sediminibacterium sp.]